MARIWSWQDHPRDEFGRFVTKGGKRKEIRTLAEIARGLRRKPKRRKGDR